jgi:hypothetical protein
MELKQILEILEQQNDTTNLSFHSYFYQPDRLLINTDQATSKTYNFNQTSFNSVSFNLSKPCLKVKSLQLLNLNIPLATASSFNDYELILPYYRLRTQRNYDNTSTIFRDVPSITNLFFIRLLPSYYPPNIIPNSQNYGFNKPFSNYEELQQELSKSCSNDLATTNGSTYNFIPNDISIELNNNKFELTGNNVNNVWNSKQIPVWSETTTYSVNDVVRYTNILYVSKINSNTNNIPIVSEWELAETPIPVWYVDINYALNDLVMIDNIIYISTENNNLGNNPLSLTVWVEYTFGNLSTYLISGYEDPNNQTLMETVFIESGLFDFRYSQYNLNDIVGIPPQPFITNSKYTLSRRLGFNWNGIYNFILQENIVGYTSPTIEPLLYNRMRPIPPYEFIPELEEDDPIPNNNPYTATTYIADGFCNLVLTSIVYLYGNFIGTSALSSGDNNNLLAIIPVNCSTLGVSFTSEFLDNPFTKVNNNIQDITLEFRNEHNQPFLVGNNGIITFSFKILY